MGGWETAFVRGRGQPSLSVLEVGTSPLPFGFPGTLHGRAACHACPGRPNGRLRAQGATECHWPCPLRFSSPICGPAETLQGMQAVTRSLLVLACLAAWAAAAAAAVPAGGVSFCSAGVQHGLPAGLIHDTTFTD